MLRDLISPRLPFLRLKDQSFEEAIDSTHRLSLMAGLLASQGSGPDYPC